MRFTLCFLAIAGVSLAAKQPNAPPVPSVDVASQFILGGHQAFQGNFPYYVKIPACGGSLITPKHVLTAAHCIKDYTVGGPGSNAVMGLENRNKIWDTEGVQIRKIIKATSHKDYNNISKIDDIAIIEVDKPFDLNENVQLIRIKAEDTELQKLHWAVAVGFGATNAEGTEQVDELEYTDIPLISYDDCKKVWKYKIWYKQICGGSATSGVGGGDSGGPLAINDDCEYFQIGVVSFSAKDEADQGKFPAVYTRTSEYCIWMNKNTDGEFNCV
ncbi:hypothetical protein QR680_011511 [Steinernema hermaphroditum]|uniref:Peptidase S1 domain-containing protein n=1 Tax=Steinernema hermaphroditum TaxID=289476 RepID=A0AA39I0A4_9BILA|nr:hypothetical protein QR680_011511 [Steinernema hermaphroditum]